MSELGRIDRAIDGKNDPVDRVIAELAERQWGAVARSQLIAAGVGADAIDYRLRTGRLHQLHRGVYAVGHTRIGTHGRTMAAVLAGGPGAVTSHRRAAWLWALLWDNRPVVDVSVPGRAGRAQRGIVFHRPRGLTGGDVAVRDGIPCTSVARTLLDLAATVRPSLLRKAFEEAERQRVLDLRAVERALERSRGHRGRRALSAVVAHASGPLPMTRSDVERAFLELVRAEGLPMPVMNATVGDYEVDALWPDRRVVVEIDHFATHGHRTAFERDRVRDAELQIAGFRTGRVTDRQIASPRETGARLRRLLAGPSTASAANSATSTNGRNQTTYR